MRRGDKIDVDWKFIATHMLRWCWNNHLLNLSKFKSHFRKQLFVPLKIHASLLNSQADFDFVFHFWLIAAHNLKTIFHQKFSFFEANDFCSQINLTFKSFFPSTVRSCVHFRELFLANSTWRTTKWASDVREIQKVSCVGSFKCLKFSMLWTNLQAVLLL